MPLMEFHAIVEGYEVDFLVIGTNVVIECDGWGATSPIGISSSSMPLGLHLAAGYVPMQVTWQQLTRSPRPIRPSPRRRARAMGS